MTDNDIKIKDIKKLENGDLNVLDKNCRMMNCSFDNIAGILPEGEE